MAQEEQILIEVKFDASAVENAKASLSANLKQLKDNKAELAQLNKTLKENGELNEEESKRYAELNGKIEANKRAIKSSTAIIQAATKEREKDNTSLDAQRQRLNTLQKAYAGLTAEQKEAMGGAKELEKQIKALSDSIKDQEERIGSTGRNVGNYTESIDKAFKAAQLGSTGLGKVTDSLDKTMKLAANNPWMAVLSLMLPLLQHLFKALMGNEQAMAEVKKIMDALSNVFKQFEPIISKVGAILMNTLVKAFDIATAAIGKLLAGVDKLAAKFGKELHLADAFAAVGESAADAADEVEESNERIITSTQDTADKQAEILQNQRDEMRRRNQTDLQNQLEDLQKAMDKELAILGLTEEEKQKVRDYYTDLMAQKVAEGEAAEQARIDAEAKLAEDMEKAKMEARQKAREEFGLDPAKTPEEQELELLQVAYENDLLNFEEYQIAKTSIQDKYSQQRQETEQSEVDQASKMFKNSMKEVGDSSKAMFTAFGDMVGEFIDDEKEAEAAQKAFALGSILLNEAMSIAQGADAIAAAMAGAANAASAGGPAAPILLAAYQAQMVGQVIAMIASVASTIVSSKQVFSQANNAGKFADGGIVGGTSYTGDRLTAHVNSREMILPLPEQKVLFDTLSSAADGHRTFGFDYEMMALANAALPSPTVVYTELQEFGEKVSTYQEIASV